jgi:carbon-monoxide dehydrogenase large subunit
MTKFGIGQPVRRVEDQRILTGRGRYVDDINLAHQAYGALVLSPHAHARIVGVVKGIGEAGAIGAPATIVNAIIDALTPLGIAHIDMSATPGKIWESVQRATA